MKMTEPSQPLGKPHRLTMGISMALSAMAMSMFVMNPLMAQDQSDDSSSDQAGENVLEEVIVTGTRQLIQDQITIKRDAVMVVDGLSASDIGDLPALSIGEALESLTGVASHRENGGATEVSIRGMGPYLSATTFNGREATNGSGDRSVNFSQFPSELMNKLMVYKTQDATLIEGGVSGLIALETLKPLDYDKRRFQFSMKGNYNPRQQNLNDSMNGDWGWRGTLSYVDQFEFENGGELGVSVGYQRSDISQPEQEVRGSSPTGSSLYACLNEPSITNTGFFRDSSGDCEDTNDGSGSNQGYNTEINPETGKAYDDGKAFAFAPSSRGYRQNDTEDERDAVFGAMQWRPNDRLEIMADIEVSNRTQSELRQDLNFANQKRATVGVTGPTLVTSPKGAILDWTGTTAIESNSETYFRREKYRGGGLFASYDATDRLTLSMDASWSKTTRVEKQVLLRLQSDDQDIYGNDTPGGYRPDVQWDLSSGIPQFTLTDFNVLDPALFSDEYRARIDSDVDRTNKIKAVRGDFALATEWGAITALEGGLRYSELTYLNLGGTRYTTPNLDDSSEEERAAILAINELCRNDVFPEAAFLSSQAAGNPITVVDGDTGEEIEGTGSAWATFDTMCATNAILDYHGVDFAYPDQVKESPSTTDVKEEVWAGYLMASYESSLAGKDFYGNFGVRIVNTKTNSYAWRTEYEIIEDNDGFLSIQPVPGADLEKVNADNSYTEWLPSFNYVMDIQDNVILRGGIFRAMSRADPSDLGYNRAFTFSDDSDITDPDDLIQNVSGSGNPYMDPLMSWNFDVSLEWYPNDDSILSAGLYYKDFNGGFEQITTLETFIVDGVDITAPVTVTQVSDDSSTLYGLEVTAAHNFSYLPSFWSGFGVKLSLNLAHSNFEFEDSNYGTVFEKDLEGNSIQKTVGIVAPGNLPGFSDTVFSGNVYYQIGNFDASLIYKYRSEYFQPYTSNGTRLRYVGDVGVWEARASYWITDNLQLLVEGINLFNEPKQTYYYTDDNFGEMNIYGARYFLGIRGKF